MNEGKLESVNVGDSGFIIIRDGQVAQTRQVTIHGFNFPFQLGKDGSDSPEDGVVGRFEIKLEDIIIMGTDGLWDNLFEKEIAQLVVWKSDMANLAKNIGEEARLAATEPGRKTPWSGVGGKLDDISVIATRVIFALRFLFIAWQDVQQGFLVFGV